MNFSKKRLLRNLPFAFLLLASVISCKRQTPLEKTDSALMARIIFNDSIYDFGTFLSSSPIQQHAFTFVNNSNIPAVILNVVPSCQCTSVKYTQDAIPPGKSGKVEITFDGTKSATGYFSKSVRVRINSLHTYALSIKGCMK